MAHSQEPNWLLGGLSFEAQVMYLTFSLHCFSLCSGLNVFGHVDSVLDFFYQLLGICLTVHGL